MAISYIPQPGCVLAFRSPRLLPSKYCNTVTFHAFVLAGVEIRKKFSRFLDNLSVIIYPSPKNAQENSTISILAYTRRD